MTKSNYLEDLEKEYNEIKDYSFKYTDRFVNRAKVEGYLKGQQDKTQDILEMLISEKYGRSDMIRLFKEELELSSDNHTKLPMSSNKDTSETSQVAEEYGLLNHKIEGDDLESNGSLSNKCNSPSLALNKLNDNILCKNCNLTYKEHDNRYSHIIKGDVHFCKKVGMHLKEFEPQDNSQYDSVEQHRGTSSIQCNSGISTDSTNNISTTELKRSVKNERS
jgi:hypothetical protein